jgi:hypothetical protein
VKSSSTVISSAFGASAGGPEVDVGLHAPSLTALVPACEQWTSATTETFRIPEGEAAGENELFLIGAG